MNKRIKKKLEKGRPVNIKSYHTARQVAYKVGRHLSKKGITHYGYRTGRFSSTEHHVISIPREDHNFIPVGNYIIQSNSYPEEL